MAVVCHAPAMAGGPGAPGGAKAGVHPQAAAGTVTATAGDRMCGKCYGFTDDMRAVKCKVPGYKEKLPAIVKAPVGAPTPHSKDFLKVAKPEEDGGAEGEEEMPEELHVEI